MNTYIRCLKSEWMKKIPHNKTRRARRPRAQTTESKPVLRLSHSPGNHKIPVPTTQPIPSKTKSKALNERDRLVCLLSLSGFFRNSKDIWVLLKIHNILIIIYTDVCIILSKFLAVN